MSMTKKDFVSLANKLKAIKPVPYNRDEHRRPNSVDADMRCVESIAVAGEWNRMTMHLADWLEEQYSRFDRNIWLDYIDGKCGPSGGKL